MNPPKPLIVCFVGPNGAGKSSLRALIRPPMIFINADEIAAEQKIGAYAAAEIAEKSRQDLFAARVSFSFETVMSDPFGAKVNFLRQAKESGYHVIVHFVGLDSAAESNRRVYERVTLGGHDVPEDKIHGRYPRVLENLARLVGQVNELWIYDNSSSIEPYRLIAKLENYTLLALSADIPAYLAFLNLSALVNPDTVMI